MDLWVVAEMAAREAYLGLVSLLANRESRGIEGKRVAQVQWTST
jgi:hypothetical protein